MTNNTGAFTNSFFNFSTGGTLTTSNALGAVAANIILASNNTSWAINGTWNMLGGNNTITSAVAGVNASVNIGSGVSGARVYVASNAVLNLSGYAFVIGNFGNNNQLVINGGVLTNVSTSSAAQSGIGNNGDSGNSLIISNGGQFYGGYLNVGFNSSNNLYQVGGLGASSFASNGSLNVAAIFPGQNNQVIVTNATLKVGVFTFGNGGGLALRDDCFL